MQVRSGEVVEVAGLGRRIAATLIDTAALFLCLVIMIGLAAVVGALELPDPETTSPFDLEATRASVPSWASYATYVLLFAYYAILEGLVGTTLGKRALGMQVTMDDGRRLTPAAVVIRNLIRIPEAFFFYIPSLISCAVSARRKRLGDFAARDRKKMVSPGPRRRTASSGTWCGTGRVPTPDR